LGGQVGDLTYTGVATGQVGDVAHTGIGAGLVGDLIYNAETGQVGDLAYTGSGMGGDLAYTGTELEAVLVEGRAASLVGSASASSEGSVGYLELRTRPFLRRGELLEVIPGVVITQHSGGGKANQYFLRGFNLDHGTDFALSVDGMPVNMRSHAHGQGYSDINFIIPEFVRNIDYTKGPFAADVGDFSAAGAARFELFETLPDGFTTLEVGENNYTRAVAGNTFVHRDGSATTAGLEFTRDDGPWLLKDELRRFNGIVRHVWNAGAERTSSLTALAYKARWNASDQIPQRAIDAGILPRFGYVDPTNGGESERLSVSFAWRNERPDEATRFNAYLLHYGLDLYSNFTYFLNDPVNGDQFNQRDRRTVAGFDLEHTGQVKLWKHRTQWTVGLQGRHDRIGELELNRTAEREHIGTVRSDDVRETSLGLYARAKTQWRSWLRSEAGVRGDGYHFDVESDLAANSGKRHAAIVSPKVSLVAGPWNKTELYLNGGFGFHSNDARGTTIRIDPTDGVTPADRVHPLVRSRGLEAGVRTSVVPGLVSTVSVWYLDLESELVFVGDAGGTEATGATRRYGVEWSNFYKISSWLALDADIALTHARYEDASPNDRIANSVGTVVAAGLTVGRSHGLFGAARLRYFGAQPLSEDGTVEQPSSSTLNMRVGWRTRTWEFAVDVLNLLDRNNNDIAYFYDSRLSGEPAGGVSDIHVHPAEPRTFRVSATRRF